MFVTWNNKNKKKWSLSDVQYTFGRLECLLATEMWCSVKEKRRGEEKEDSTLNNDKISSKKFSEYIYNNFLQLIGKLKVN